MASKSQSHTSPSASFHSSQNTLPKAFFIRLLDLHAAWDGEPIVCTLKAVDLDELPVFYALTYVWDIKGDSAEAIQCDGVLLEVIHNCHAALAHIRSRYGKVRLWVDALCINQNDRLEKEHQITLMSRIYASS